MEVEVFRKGLVTARAPWCNPFIKPPFIFLPDQAFCYPLSFYFEEPIAFFLKQYGDENHQYPKCFRKRHVISKIDVWRTANSS
jgi:hypothetical protein